ALTEDPYALCSVPGVGFRTADALAQALGLEADAPARLRAGVLHALGEAEADGHCLLPRAELAERARRLLGADPGDAVDELAVSGRVMLDDDRVAEARLHRVETRHGEHVRTLVDVGRRGNRGVGLCAPTGKAARRLAETTAADARTIHRLLEWVPGEGPARGLGDPLAADVLVVDEASMLDVRLAEALLAAV